MGETRRNATIVFTDRKDSTITFQTNEQLGDKIRCDHDRLIRRLVRQFGAIIQSDPKETGDLFCLIFDSTVEAVTFALKVQSEIDVKNSQKQDDEKYWVRIGIHVGDVLVDGRHFAGNAINVASRIYELSDPGGVCLSEAAFQMIQPGTISRGIYSIGRRKLYNVEEKMELYKVACDSVRPKDGLDNVQSEFMRRAINRASYANVISAEEREILMSLSNKIGVADMQLLSAYDGRLPQIEEVDTKSEDYRERLERMKALGLFFTLETGVCLTTMGHQFVSAIKLLQRVGDGGLSLVGSDKRFTRKGGSGLHGAPSGKDSGKIALGKKLERFKNAFQESSRSP